MTKQSSRAEARNFMRAVRTDARDEHQVLASSLTSPGTIMRPKDDGFEIDIAFPGRTGTTVPSLRADPQRSPDMKLRRYHARIDNSGRVKGVLPASAGVDIDTRAFLDLVEKTSEMAGPSDHATDVLVSRLLDDAERHRTDTQFSDGARFTAPGPRSPVNGIARRQGRIHIDDYPDARTPLAPDQPELERRPDGPHRRQSDEDRQKTVRRIAEEMHAAKSKSPASRQPRRERNDRDDPR